MSENQPLEHQQSENDSLNVREKGVNRSEIEGAISEIVVANSPTAMENGKTGSASSAGANDEKRIRPAAGLDNIDDEPESVSCASETECQESQSIAATTVSAEAQAAEATGTTGSEAIPAPPAKREGIGKTFGIVAVLSFLSKFFGLARDIVILGAFGAAADAYNYACLFTNNILVLFGGLGGPFHSTSVAILSARKSEEAARDLVGQLLFITSATLCVLTVLMWTFAPQLVALVVPAQELSQPDRLRLWGEIVPILRIMSPLAMIAGLVGLGAGISNSYKEFFWPSLSPAVANIAIIAAVLLWWLVPGVSRDTGAQLQGMAMSAFSALQAMNAKEGMERIGSILQCFLWLPMTGLLILGVGTLIGAVGQLGVQLPGMLRAKPRFTNFKFAPGLKEYLIMLGPAAISTSVGQINVYIDSFFVSSLEPGSMSAIVNANRLIQLPLGVLLTAMLVPILPRFTEQIAAGQVDEMKKELSKSLRIVWFLVIPLVTMLLAIPDPIVKLLFERGQFGEEMRYLVVTALMFLVPQAFFYIPRDLVTRAFYAHQDSNTPFRVGLCAIAVKFIANYVLVVMLGFGVGGITLSTTLVTVFNMVLLSHLLRKRIGPLGITKLIRPAFIMLAASCIAGVITHYTQEWLLKYVPLQQIIGSFASLLVSIGVACGLGLAMYGLICLGLKLDEPKLALAKLQSTTKRFRR